MKTTTIVLALVSLGINTLSAQVAQTKPATADVTDGAAQYKEVERDAHSRVWARVSNETNKLGEVTTSTNSYTELATGLHYRSGDNWLPSEAKIEILPNNSGAAASKGQHKAIFPPEIKSGIVELQTSDNLWLRSRIWGLAYFDGTTGESVLIAEVKESTGQVVGDNVVIYPDAFTDVQADIRYTYTLAGFEQDVVLRQQLAGPEKFGMNEKNSRLQVLTEFVESPTPTKETRQAGGLVDQSLGWGQMSIGSGKAFSVDAVGDTTGDVPVAKEWTPLDGRNFLIEEVRYEKVAEQLQKLPTAGEYNGASLQRRGTGENVIAGLKKIIPKRYAKAAPKPGTKRMAQVKPTSAPGFVMDYFILNNQANYTFGADTNYYVSGLVNLTGTTTIEGGTIVKYTNHYSAKISMSGSLICKTDPYRPAVFTSKDDNTVGETIPGSTGNPTNYNGGTYLSGGSSATYKHLRFSYAGVGIYGYPDTGGIWHCQFFRCATAVQSADADITLRDVLFSKCGTAVSSSYGGNVVRGEHVTADQLNVFYDCTSASNTGCVTNSIFTAVTNIGQYVTRYNCITNSSGSGIYQTVGAGSYYLAENSTNRNAGTTSINSTLANDLTNRTTYPPILLTNNFTTDTTLSPQAARDTDQPDLGYHYDPIDYAVSGRAVSANLTLSGGVTLGTYGAANSYGLGLNSGSFVSEGTPTRLNWIVRYNTVQEQSTNNWSASTAGAGVQMNDSAATAKVRFTAWSLLGASGTHFNDSRESMTPTAFSHSRFCGGKFTVDPSSIALTNCLWERVYVTVKSDADNVPWYVFNNSFFGGTFYYRGRGDSDLTLAFDNLFDKTVITRGTGGTSDYFTHGNNGYVGGITHLQGTSSGGDINVTWPAGYQDGPLGKYYYNTGGNLNVLINADNTRNPANVGLYHYTVKKAENTREGTDTPANLDIGFHYAAVDANGNPVDGDGDGLADYLEDTNGNGSYGTGDLADLGATDTDGDGMSDGWEWYNFGTFSRDGSEDYDGDGMIDSVEAQHGADPNTILFDMNFGNLRVNSNTATGTVVLIKGVPDKIAILLDNTNFTSACWLNFNSNVLVNLGPPDGKHEVWIGVKGRADTSSATWGDWPLTRDTTPPAIVITNPVVSTLTQPILQLQGYSPEPLTSLYYDLTNAAGSLTNEQGYVSKQWFDTNLFELTTNWFECVDIGLTNGTNIINLRATDQAGNVTSNTYTYVLDYSGDTTAPGFTLHWPPNGAMVSGASFTLRGLLDDPTATVMAQIVDANNVTNSATGLVERDGLLWVEDLPLGAGTNVVTLTMTDAAGNVSSASQNVVKSDLVLTMDPVAEDLWQAKVSVSGTISDTSYAVWVNGIHATVNNDGTWSATDVPVNAGGTASFVVTAYAPGEQQP